MRSFCEIYLIVLIGNRLKTSAQCLYRAPGKMTWPYTHLI